MTSVRVLVGVLAVLLLVGSAVGCGQAADKSKQEAKKKVEGKAQQAKQEAKKKGQTKEQQAKKQAKKKLEQKKQDVIKTVAIKESDFKLSPSTVTLSKPGTYAMYCPVDGHEQMGMKGKVVVK